MVDVAVSFAWIWARGWIPCNRLQVSNLWRLDLVHTLSDLYAHIFSTAPKISCPEILQKGVKFHSKANKRNKTKQKNISTLILLRKVTNANEKQDVNLEAHHINKGSFKNSTNTERVFVVCIIDVFFFMILPMWAVNYSCSHWPWHCSEGLAFGFRYEKIRGGLIKITRK